MYTVLLGEPISKEKISYRGPAISRAVQSQEMPKLEGLDKITKDVIKQEAAFFRKINPILSDNDPLAKKCSNIAKDLLTAAGADPDWANVMVYSGKIPDAHVCYYTGDIRISTGMLKLLDYKEGNIAAILAHEVSHPILKQGAAANTRITMRDAKGDVIKQRVASYEEEYQADRLGVILLNRLGYKKGLMNEVLTKILEYEEKLAKEDKNFRQGTDEETESQRRANLPWVVATHPYISRRLSALDHINRSLPGGMGRKGAKNISRPDWENFIGGHNYKGENLVNREDTSKELEGNKVLDTVYVDCPLEEIGLNPFKTKEKKSELGRELIEQHITPQEAGYKASDGREDYEDPLPEINEIPYIPEQVEQFCKDKSNIPDWWDKALHQAQDIDGIDDLVNDINQYSSDVALKLLQNTPALDYVEYDYTSALFHGEGEIIPWAMSSLTALLMRQAFGKKIRTKQGLTEALKFLHDYRTTQGVYLPYDNLRLIVSAADIFNKAKKNEKAEIADLIFDYEDEICRGDEGKIVNLSFTMLSQVYMWIKSHGRKKDSSEKKDPENELRKKLSEAAEDEKLSRRKARAIMSEFPHNFAERNWTAKAIGAAAVYLSEGSKEDQDIERIRKVDTAARYYSTEEFEREHFGEGRNSYQATRYDILDKDSFIRKDFQKLWERSGYEKQAKKLEGKERVKFILEHYRVSSGRRDQLLVEALGWHYLGFIEDVEDVQEDILKSKDRNLLARLSRSFSHEYLRVACSKRLWDLSGKYKNFIKSLPSFVAEDAKQQLKDVYKPENYGKLETIVACFPQPSFARDEMIRPFIDAAPDEESTMSLAVLLSEPPPGGVQVRSTSTVAVSESLLDAIASLDSVDKEEILLFLLGHDYFYSAIDEKYNISGENFKEMRRMALYGGKKKVEATLINKYRTDNEQFLTEGLESGPDIEHELDMDKRNEEDFKKFAEGAKKVLDAYREDMKNATYESAEGQGYFLYVVSRPDAAVLLSKYAGVPIELIMRQQRTSTTRREQRDLLAYSLIGKNGILTNGHGKQFLKQAAKTIVRNSNIDDAQRKGIEQFLVYAFSECPRQKLPDMFLDCWYASTEESTSLPDLVARLMQDTSPVLVKAGQYLSTQTASLPIEWTTAFRKLTDQNTVADKTMLYEYVHAGYSDNVPFTRLGEKLGEGSMAAVYGGELKEGREVAVKVLHPFIEDEIEEDINFLGKIVKFINSKPHLYNVNLPENLADVMKEQMKAEMSFPQETENNKTLTRVISAKCNGVSFNVPGVIEDISNRHFLVMERAHGVPLDKLTADNIGMKHATAFEIYRQIFVNGKYQADPNLGNFLADSAKNTVHWVDTGHVGMLRPEDTQLLKDFALTVAADYSPEKVAPMLNQLIKRKTPKSQKIVQSWLEERFADGVSFADSEKILNEFLDVCASNGYVLQPRWISLLKTLNLTKPMIADVDPEVAFNTLKGYITQGMSFTKLLGLLLKKK